MTKIFKHQGPAILWALFILIICTIDMGPVGDSPLFFRGFDKVTHCGLFFVMVTLITRGLVRRYPDGFNYVLAIKALIIGIIYGAAIEVAQIYLFVWRSGDWNDLFCDIIGACMATFGILVILNAAKYARI